MRLRPYLSTMNSLDVVEAHLVEAGFTPTNPLATLHDGRYVRYIAGENVGIYKLRASSRPRRPWSGRAPGFHPQRGMIVGRSKSVSFDIYHTGGTRILISLYQDSPGSNTQEISLERNKYATISRPRKWLDLAFPDSLQELDEMISLKRIPE